VFKSVETSRRKEDKNAKEKRKRKRRQLGLKEMFLALYAYLLCA